MPLPWNWGGTAPTWGPYHGKKNSKNQPYERVISGCFAMWHITGSPCTEREAILATPPPFSRIYSRGFCCIHRQALRLTLKSGEKFSAEVETESDEMTDADFVCAEWSEWEVEALEKQKGGEDSCLILWNWVSWRNPPPLHDEVLQQKLVLNYFNYYTMNTFAEEVPGLIREQYGMYCPGNILI